MAGFLLKLTGNSEAFIDTDPHDLTRLVHALPGAIFIRALAPGFPFVYLSQGAREVFGCEPEDLLGSAERWMRIVHSEDLADCLKKLQQAVDGQGSYLHECRVILPSGAERWVCARGTVNRHANGQAEALEGFIADISAQKTAEAALRTSRRNYKSIFDNSVDGIFQSRQDGSYIRINAALARIFGYASAAEMLAANPERYVDPTGQEAFGSLLASGHTVSNFESEARCKDGSIIWISESGRLVGPADDPTSFYEGNLKDVTRRRLAEQSLARERNMLRTLIDNWPDVIYVKDLDGRFLLSNAAHTRLLNIEETQPIEGRTCQELADNGGAERFSTGELALLASGQPAFNQEEVRVCPPDGREVVFATTRLPLRNPLNQVVGLVCISRDLTEQRKLEVQLRQSQKMEAIGSLAGGIAHDFNNLLTAILGYSDWIMHTSDEVASRAAAEIHSAATRATELTQQLLAFSRQQLIQPQLLNLNAVLERMHGTLHRLLGDGIELILQSAPQNLSVRSDAGQLEQVIINMASNARDAMPAGGRLTIGLNSVFLPLVNPFSLPSGRYARLSIADNGCGIPEAIQGRIFDPFFTTKSQAEGTGLGLATCYGIVQQNHGHISVQSRVHHGATFDIYLPQVEIVTNAAAASLPHGDETILLVEDDQAVRTFTSGLLSDLGYNVLLAEDGEQALALASREPRPHIDLLLADIMMPKMDGKLLAERFAEFFPQTRILLTSGYHEEASLQIGLRAKHVLFLQKPYSPTVVARKLREELQAA